MAEPIAVRVLTDAGLAVEDTAVSIVAPGALGYLGVLSHHAPLITMLQPGTLTWRTPHGRTRQLHVDEGLLEVTKNRLTVLTKAVTEHAEPRDIGMQ